MRTKIIKLSEIPNPDATMVRIGGSCSSDSSEGLFNHSPEDTKNENPIMTPPPQK